MSTDRTVLICDDDPLMLDLVDFRLQSKGYKVERAGDGEEALEKVAALRPDVVVLDAMMPKTNGFEVLSRIKESPELADTIVVMLTARKAEQDIVSALEKGADEYLVKPFIPEELLVRLSRLLGRKA